MITDTTTIYIVAACAAMVLGLIAVVVFLSMKGVGKKDFFEEQLEELKDYGDNGEEAARITPITRWNAYWGKLFKQMGWSGYAESESRAGRDVFLVIAAVSIVGTILTRNPLISVGLSVGMAFIISVLLKNMANRKNESMNDQLPGFLFALKANVQANETPEAAILKIVDNMPSPLYEDLVAVKQKLLANATFQEAIEELGKKTTNRDLKFLCSCMVQAANTGTNLENQITVIQNVLESRRKVTQELDKAIKAVAPSIWVSTLVLPGTFIIMYFMSSTARDFWFNDFISWVAFGALIFFYAAGMLITKRMVDGIRNL